MEQQNNIVLPRKDANGDYYISYSQFSSWKDAASFNLGVKGSIEYMVGYFFGHKFPDQGWGEFGKVVEDFICEGTSDDFLTTQEKETLSQIKPLGNFQIEVKLWILPNVYLLGYIDDGNKELTWIRDYKTASNNSRQKYYKDDYVQLDLYAMWVLQETGKLPEKLEVCIIERKGNCFGMVERRDLLSVGKEVWYHEREISKERLDKIKSDLIQAVMDISKAYSIYLKMNKL